MNKNKLIYLIPFLLIGCASSNLEDNSIGNSSNEESSFSETSLKRDTYKLTSLLEIESSFVKDDITSIIQIVHSPINGGDLTYSSSNENDITSYYSYLTNAYLTEASEILDGGEKITTQIHLANDKEIILEVTDGIIFIDSKGYEITPPPSIRREENLLV